MKIGDKITDGSATFVVRSKKGGVQSIDDVRPDDAGNISMWDTFHRYGDNYVSSDTSNAGWNKLGFCSIYYNQNKIKNQPSQYGQLINIPSDSHNESTQLWIAQDTGIIYSRIGNSNNGINGAAFKRFAITDEVNDSLERLKGNHTPVVTDIFDRAGIIDMSTMSDSDKATHKAKINKAKNASQDIWSDSYGIYAYGGGLDMQNSYPSGTIKLTQSYKDFDKIFIRGCNDSGTYLVSKMWDVWEFSFMLSNSYRFSLFDDESVFWYIYGNTYQGTRKNYTLSTDTVWCCDNENSGIIGIYGIKY